MIDRNRSVRTHLLCLLTAAAVAVAGLAAVAAETRLTGVVNVNTATLEELQLLPGIGETRARAVITLRKQRGGFKTVDELLEVKGIGDRSLARLRRHLAVSGKTTARLE